MHIHASVCGLFFLVALWMVQSLHAVFNPNFPSRKSWWAKRITDDYFVCGRLTERQVKYADESGFMSLVSLGPHPTTVTVRGRSLPSDDVISALATQHLTMSYTAAVLQDEAQVVERFSDVDAALQSAAKPVLVTSSDSYYAALAVLLHSLKRGTIDLTDSTPHGQRTAYQRAAVMGYNYTGMSAAIAELLEEDEVSDPEQPSAVPPHWYTLFWQMKPLYKNNYFAGQILREDLESLKALGTPALINTRRGVVHETTGAPKQEEATLLNIRDRTDTYANGGRQTEQRLLATRLDPDKSPSYISPTSDVNYERMNPLAFGDEIGYNETREAQVVRAEGFHYVHTPMGNSVSYSEEAWVLYKDEWLDHGLDEVTPVLYHCRTGMRSIGTAMIAVSYKYGWSATQAVHRARLLGYNIAARQSNTVYNAWVRVLDLGTQYQTVLDRNGWWERMREGEGGAGTVPGTDGDSSTQEPGAVTTRQSFSEENGAGMRVPEWGVVVGVLVCMYAC